MAFNVPWRPRRRAQGNPEDGAKESLWRRIGHHFVTTSPTRIQWTVLVAALALLGGAYGTLQGQPNEARSEAAADRKLAIEA